MFLSYPFGSPNRQLYISVTEKDCLEFSLTLLIDKQGNVWTTIILSSNANVCDT